MKASKPVILYLHRYPPEIEAVQWPALEELAEAFSAQYEFVYLGMRRAQNEPIQSKLREKMRIIEVPFPVTQANGRDKLVKTILWYLYMPWILRKIRELKPAVILCKEALWFIPTWVARLGFPTLITTSDWWWSILFGDHAWGRRLAAYMERKEVQEWNLQNVWTTVTTQTEKYLLTQKGFPPERIIEVSWPQNARNFGRLTPRPTKSELGLNEEMVYFAIIGIIRKGKGYDQLLNWWVHVSLIHPNYKLVIIGGGGGERWCRREIKKRRLEQQVIMTGWLPTKSDVNRWLNAMDGVLVQRRNSPDNLGLIPSALFNGLSSERPVMVTGLPGMKEVVTDGVTAFVWEPDHEESFIHALERVVENPEQATQIGQAGAQRAAEYFSPRKVIQDHIDSVEQMIRQHENSLTHA